MKTNFICVSSGYEPKTTIHSYHDKFEPWGNVNLENK